MKWIIGVDVGTRSRGALHFSRWLAEAAGVRWREAFVPVHVLDQEHLRMLLRYHHLDDIVQSERAAVLNRIAEVLDVGDAVPETVQATTVAEGLEAERARHHAAGVIVARAAPRDSRRVFRLGGVARRLLQRLASPLVVVPPDLTASSIGDGPVVALSSLAADSVDACRLARSVADDAHRDLTIVHVRDDRRGRLAPPARGRPPGLREITTGPFTYRDRALARWVSQHAVWPDLAAAIDGDFPSAAVAFAEARRAPLVAIGAHPSTGVRSAIEPKLWRWLAAHARQPVLVVPAADAALESPLGTTRVEDEAARPHGPAT